MIHDASMPPLPPGRDLVERHVSLPDGRRLRTVTAGDAEGPLVLFESGMGGPAAEWLAVQRSISRKARTLAYDRAGYGGSDVDTHERTLDRIVDDLAAMLDALSENGPLVIVGHSWGGAIATVFADRYPERLAALVLVEGTPALAIDAGQAKLNTRLFRVLGLFAQVRATGVAAKLMLPYGLSTDFDATDANILWRDFLSVRGMQTAVSEAKHLLRERDRLLDLQSPLRAEAPIRALQSAPHPRKPDPIRERLNSAVAQMVTGAPHGSFTLVTEAGHLIPLEQPMAVVESVRAVLSHLDR